MIIVMTTCSSRSEAEKIARALLSERLVACVNMWPVRSQYWFERKIERASELMLVCKTKKTLASRVERRIKALHSYKFPVIEQWEARRVSKEVREWLNAATL